MRLVIDVSNVNPISSATFKASGAVALIAKATEGTSFQDRTLSEHRDIAKRAGKPFGSYVFLHPDSGGSEAGYYLKYARPRRGDIQPIIDAEVTNLGTADLARRTNACALALEAEGYRPLLYASSSIWRELVAAEPKLKRLRVWEAQYPGRFTRWFPRVAKLRVKIGTGVSVVLWQWSDAYAVGSRHFDGNALLVDIDSILIGPRGGGAGKSAAL